MTPDATHSIEPNLVNAVWLVAAAALVLLMQGGFCCLESGLARAKNSINVAIKDLVGFCIASIAFWAVGFGLMFGDSWKGLVGTDLFALGGGAGAWLIAFLLFQIMVCGAATTIVSGAIAERTRFCAYLLVCVVVAAFIYPVFGQWAWGGLIPETKRGWLAASGFVDMAGATVVHSVGGWVALAAAIHVGPRLGRFDSGSLKIHGHNLPLATLGCILLWFGWFGLTGGSMLGLSDSLPLILLNTNFAAAAGGLAGLGSAACLTRRAEVGATISGALAGLVAVTAGCHAFGPGAAILVGAVGGLVAVLGERLLEEIRVDDVVGAIPVHAFAGVWGTLAVALLGDLDRLGTGLSRWDQLSVQSLGVVTCFGWAFAWAFVVLGMIRLVTPLRVTAEAERVGLNIHEHGASTELIDLITAMTAQRERADFSERVDVEPHTEVGQIAAEYNRVLDRVAAEIEIREAATEVTREAEERYRSFFENAVEGIFQTTPAGRYLSANPALARIFGYDSPEQLMAELDAGAPGFYVDEGRREEFLRRIEADEVVTDFESRVRHRDGGIIWIKETARAVRDGGYLLCYEGTVEEVTQRKLAEQFEHEKEAAQARDRAKSAFLANMSHEIRTPLNGVIGMLNLLSDGSLDQKQTRFVRVARQSADALLSLINDILDFSKIEAGRLELEQIEFNLHELLENVAEMFGHRAAEKRVELTCFVRPNTPAAVVGDPERLRQILVNLTNNAIKFTETGEVRLAAERVDDPSGEPRIRLSVTDTGIGIPADRIRALFSPFTQVDASTTRKYGGTGLGLAICRQLVQLMGGEIGVDSTPGDGSAFWILLPLRVVGDGAPRPRRLPERLHDLRILGVDDNATNRELLTEQLSAWGFVVETIADPFAALGRMSEAAAAGTPFRLVLLDHQMPGLDGLTLARRIKNDPELQKTTLLLLTSVDRLPSQEEQAECGLAGAMTKPLRQSRLFDVIVDALHGASKPHLPAVARYGNALPTALPPGSAGRVLVAEDNETNQLVTTELLLRSGYECVVAVNGREVIERIARESFDVVLMDCQMPEMDGFEATTRLRMMETEGTSARPGRTPVIALTANAVTGDRERCLDAGMDDYIPKPIDPVSMLATIAKYVAGAPHSGSEQISRPPAIGCDKNGDAISDAATGSERDVPLVSPPGTDEELHTLVSELQVDSAGPVESPPVDYEALLNRCLGDNALADRVLTKFARRLSEDVRKIRKAFESGDRESLRQQAHSVKGAAANVAADPLAGLAAAIERHSTGDNPDIEAARADFGKLVIEADRLLAIYKEPIPA